LAEPIDSAATGWAKVDNEIGELRRAFASARSPQAFRAVGVHCVGVLEALSRTVYDPARHLRPGESVPSPDKTKQRIGRYIEMAVPGSSNEEVRGLANKASELAHHVKHSETPSWVDASIAADAVILLSYILVRLEGPGPQIRHEGLFRGVSAVDAGLLYGLVGHSRPLGGEEEARGRFIFVNADDLAIERLNQILESGLVEWIRHTGEGVEYLLSPTGVMLSQGASESSDYSSD
jgi:hypothetical protein